MVISLNSHQIDLIFFSWQKKNAELAFSLTLVFPSFFVSKALKALDKLLYQLSDKHSQMEETWLQKVAVMEPKELDTKVPTPLLDAAVRSVFFLEI